MIQITQSYLTNSPCYKTKRNIKVSGLMLHSVGCPQPNAQVFIKNWNTSSCKVGVHAFADTTGVFETLPCRETPGIAHRAWHCGSGSKGSFNNSHISLEMTEPSCIKYVGGSTFTCSDIPKAQEHVRKTTQIAIEYFAMLCIYHNLDPLGKNVIVSHKEGHDLGYSSGHNDPSHIWDQLHMNYTMDNFRQDVYQKVQELKYGVNNKEDDDNMDVKTFEKLFNEYRMTLRDNDHSKYSEEAMKWALETGIIQGNGTINGEPNTMAQDFMTREQLVTVLYRFAKHIGKA